MKKSSESFKVGDLIDPDDNEFEKTIVFNEENESGFIKKIELLNGAVLRFEKRSPIKNRPFLVEDEKYSIGFGFCFSGAVDARLTSLKKEYSISRNESSMFCFSNTNGSYRVSPSNDLVRLFIEIDPETFFEKKWFSQLMPDDLIKKFHKKGPIFYRTNDKITPQMNLIINQILNCPYHGNARRFFLEGKVFELIACKIDRIENSVGKIMDKPVRSSDKDRIDHAKRLMEDNFKNPLSMKLLAKELGVSRTKFYCDFVKIHGSSPTDFLRNLRMEKAADYLIKYEMNVSEAAWAVGYSNLSYFSRVFREYFNLPPSEYRKRAFKKI